MSNKKYKYALGLDIGVASIGWSAVELDDNDNPIRVIDLGARIFKALDNDKGKIYNEVRREKRGLRRLITRRKERLRRIYSLCKKYDLYADKSIVFNQSNGETIYDIKLRGLEHQLSGYDLVRCLVHYAKNRGFKSNRKEINEDKDASKIKDSIHKLQLIQESYDCTITKAMLILKDQEGLDKFKNRDGEYHYFYDRLSLEKEATQLLDKQIEYGLIDKEFKNKYLEILLSQRDFSEGPGFKDYDGNLSPYAVNFEQAFGLCKFRPSESRIAKATPTYEFFVFIQKLLDFRYYKRDSRREVHNLTAEQINFVVDRIKEKPKKEVLIKDIVSYIKLDLNEFEVMNLPTLTKTQYIKVLNDYLKSVGENTKRDDLTEEQVEEFENKIKEERYKHKIGKFEIYSEFSKKLGTKEIGILDSVGTILTFAKTDKKISEYLEKEEYSNITDEIANKMKKELTISKKVSGSGSLSLSLCRDLIKEFLKGNNYSTAMQNLGYNHSDLALELDEDEFPTILEIENKFNTVITSPNVKHVLVMVRKLYNAIYKKYGKPEYIRIELAREMNKTFSERNTIANEQLNNRVNRLTIKNKLAKLYNVSDRDYFSNEDILRYQLFEEQNGICMYSGKEIDPAKLLTNQYQVDHIIPYSISYDDSYTNKVLVLTSANQSKLNRVPIQWLKGDDLDNFIKRVKLSRLSLKKKEHLLVKEYRKDDKFSNRDFNDTSHISRIVTSTFKAMYGIKNEDSNKKVTTSSGGQTSLLRGLYQLNRYTHSLIALDYDAYQAKSLKFRIKDYKSTKNSITISFENDLGMTHSEERKVIMSKKDGKEDFKNIFESDFSKLLNSRFDIFQSLIANLSSYRDILNIKDNDLLVFESSDLEFTARQILSEIFVSTKQKIQNQKNRDTHFHHMIDATLIAILDEKMKSRLNKYRLYNKILEERYYNTISLDKSIFHPETGEQLTVEQFIEMEKNTFKFFKSGRAKFNPPYENFIEELVVRVFERDKDILRQKISQFENYKDVDIENINIRYPSHYYSTKVSGALHAETLVGVKENVGAVSRKAVEKLNDKDIENLYDKDGGQKEVYQTLLNWVKNGHKGSPTLPNGRLIKKVTVVDKNVDKLLKVSSSNKSNAYAGISELARILVFKREDDDYLYFAQIDNMRYLKYKKNNYDFDIVLWKAQGEKNKQVINLKDADSLGFNLYEVLIPGEMIHLEFKKDKSPIYCGVVGFTSGMFEIYSIIGDNTDIESTSLHKLQQTVTVSTIKSINKIKIDILGNLIR